MQATVEKTTEGTDAVSALTRLEDDLRGEKEQAWVDYVELLPRQDIGGDDAKRLKAAADLLGKSTADVYADCETLRLACSMRDSIQAVADESPKMQAVLDRKGEMIRQHNGVILSQARALRELDAEMEVLVSPVPKATTDRTELGRAKQQNKKLLAHVVVPDGELRPGAGADFPQLQHPLKILSVEDRVRQQGWLPAETKGKRK